LPDPGQHCARVSVETLLNETLLLRASGKEAPWPIEPIKAPGM
jgi:hypothetical protein